MSMFREAKEGAIGIRKQKRADLVAEELKRLITQRNLKPGDKLPHEIKLQQMFSVSKSTIREALKSLEVQGLISVSTGPSGGATIVEVPLDRTFQLMQNYLFFKDVGIADVYTVRRLLEPELAAGAIPHLTEDDFLALERTIDLCDPASQAAAGTKMLDQRQEDLTFHDILAAANPNPMLRFCCELINEMIRQLVVFGNETPACEHERFGAANVVFHRRIVAAARARDAEAVRSLMSAHMEECTHYVTRMNGRVHGRLVLDSEMTRRTWLKPSETTDKA
ncbi:GntR family transcriptional regulator, transcriptional repressor for pyruvate dehydrogenase complex [Cupriavidus metallidurans]|jgi:DNA-binding FadR family transcriptional regulator|uniref:FadR/GntR family transcriptional regulator n=1 Tax=Cupriavidus TaxID=106589 RepID=UPI00049364E7|nr:FCD domain-containing protein [Cupriavidus metallidurans]KWW38503.1 HTH-type transcriptional regulator LutR [Cupriavidus metallidurans]MDE4920154.1 FCD domain-containing protein [Cupriavidus metallidurans]UBM07948.1 FCD domain-containing protein [Cupriavidus metallidurans]